MRLKDNNNPFIHVNPPYQLMVIHSSKLVYPRELYQRGVERKRVELIAAHFNEYVANEPKVSFRNGGKDLPILLQGVHGHDRGAGSTALCRAERLLCAADSGHPAGSRPDKIVGIVVKIVVKTK